MNMAHTNSTKYRNFISNQGYDGTIKIHWGDHFNPDDRPHDYSYHCLRSLPDQPTSRNYGNNISIKQIFNNTILEETEANRVAAVDAKLMDAGASADEMFVIRSTIPRIVEFHFRKYSRTKSDWVSESTKQCIDILRNTRREILEADVKPLLQAGVGYFLNKYEVEGFAPKDIMVLRFQRLFDHFPGFYNDPSIQRKAEAQFEDLMVFLFEYAKKYLLEPGVTETLTVIMDIREILLLRVPLPLMQRMVNLMTFLYPFRLDQLFCIHNSFAISGIWILFKVFITDAQRCKIHMMRSFKHVKGLVNVVETDMGGEGEIIGTTYPFHHVLHREAPRVLGCTWTRGKIEDPVFSQADVREKVFQRDFRSWKLVMPRWDNGSSSPRSETPQAIEPWSPRDNPRDNRTVSIILSSDSDKHVSRVQDFCVSSFLRDCCGEIVH